MAAAFSSLPRSGRAQHGCRLQSERVKQTCAWRRKLCVFSLPLFSKQKSTNSQSLLTLFFDCEVIAETKGKTSATDGERERAMESARR